MLVEKTEKLGQGGRVKASKVKQLQMLAPLHKE